MHQHEPFPSKKNFEKSRPLTKGMGKHPTHAAPLAADWSTTFQNVDTSPIPESALSRTPLPAGGEEDCCPPSTSCKLSRFAAVWTWLDPTS